MNTKALIYCRVSSKKQVEEGNGLSSQEKVCRDYAKNTLGVEVEKVFNEEGASGGVFERKSIKELFKYIDKNKKNSYVVVFEDLNRLSRDIQVHHLLRNEFRKRNIELCCLNFKFDDTPEGTLIENVNVSMAQFEREKNKQRVISRQKARLEQGFRCYKLPIGLKFSNNPKGGKLVLLDENTCKVVKSALNKFASDELNNINDVARYMHERGLEVGNVRNGKVFNSNLVARMLRNPLYAGYLEYKPWGIPLTKAKHEALISLKTYQKILKKLEVYNKNGYKTDWLSPEKFTIESRIESNNNRIDRTNDFPLRGFLYCESCNHMLSGAWSKGKKEKYPYYVFPKKSPLFGKSINSNKLHKEFEKLLEDIKPNEELIEYFIKALDIVREEKYKNQEEDKASFKKELKSIDEKINNFVERIGMTNNLTLISNYEKQILELENKKTEILEKIEKEQKQVRTPLKEDIKLARNCLRVWKSDNLEGKKKLIKSIFPKGIPINEKRQVGTPIFSLVYQAFSIGKSSYLSMVTTPYSASNKEIVIIKSFRRDKLGKAKNKTKIY